MTKKSKTSLIPNTFIGNLHLYSAKTKRRPKRIPDSQISLELDDSANEVPFTTHAAWVTLALLQLMDKKTPNESGMYFFKMAEVLELMKYKRDAKNGSFPTVYYQAVQAAIYALFSKEVELNIRVKRDGKRYWGHYQGRIISGYMTLYKEGTEPPRPFMPNTKNALEGMQTDRQLWVYDDPSLQPKGFGIEFNRAVVFDIRRQLKGKGFTHLIDDGEQEFIGATATPDYIFKLRQKYPNNHTLLSLALVIIREKKASLSMNAESLKTKAGIFQTSRNIGRDNKAIVRTLETLKSEGVVKRYATEGRGRRMMFRIERCEDYKLGKMENES